ncbi:MAG: SRPBCC family protein [Balneolaceae bacterium]
MKSANKINISVECTVKAPVEKVWEFWTAPEHITKWNSASEDWHTPRAENDLRAGGKFLSRMEARDGSMGFDFEGVYDEVIPGELIRYTMDDGRKVKITFIKKDNETQVIETFDAETENPVEMQRDGWQSVLNNFKKYAETD